MSLMVGVISYPARKRRMGMDSPETAKIMFKFSVLHFNRENESVVNVFHIKRSSKRFLRNTVDV